MSDLHLAAALLQQYLPEFTVTPLKFKIAYTDNSVIDQPRLAVQLPEQFSYARHRLWCELNERTGLVTSADGGNPRTVFIINQDARALCRHIETAISDGKLNGLTLDYLDSQTTSNERNLAMDRAASHRPKSAKPH